MQIGAATKENNMEFSQKIKNVSALRLRDSASGDLCKETQNTNSEVRMCPCVPQSLFLVDSSGLLPDLEYGERETLALTQGPVTEASAFHPPQHCALADVSPFSILLFFFKETAYMTYKEVK